MCLLVSSCSCLCLLVFLVFLVSLVRLVRPVRVRLGLVLVLVVSVGSFRWCVCRQPTGPCKRLKLIPGTCVRHNCPNKSQTSQ